ncbi:hypothetical protein HZB07_00535 [Candidatus Saganbacteria bacterium]|nr:hypothetical protein [Candidatus Saganbacteria bacterium]
MERIGLNQLAAHAARLAGSLARVARVMAKAPEVNMPLDLGMMAVPGTKMRAMRGATSIEMWRQFVRETGYQPEFGSHKANKFLSLVRGSAAGDMGFTNDKDCEAFIKWAREKTGDSTLRLPNNQEWDAMFMGLRGQLSGDNWERLADKVEQVQFFRFLRSNYRDFADFQEFRYHIFGLRLVGDNPTS